MTDYLPAMLSLFEQLEVILHCEQPDLFVVRQYHKQECLQQFNHPWSHMWLIEEGIAFSEIPTPQGNIIREFYFAGQFISNLNAWKMNRNSRVRVKALTKLRCWSVHSDDVLYCCKKYQAARVLVEQFSCCHANWQNDLLLRLKSLSAREHIRHLQIYFPQYFQLLSQKDLASFLNVSVATLYRLMSEEE